MDDEERDRILNQVRMFGDQPMYMDKYGRPISLLEWAQLCEDIEYKRVGYDELPATLHNPASYVSTVWLGLNHSFFPHCPPLLFETMRFADKKQPGLLGGSYHPSMEFPHPDDGELTDQVRYSTEEQARLGHGKIVRLIQEREMQ